MPTLKSCVCPKVQFLPINYTMKIISLKKKLLIPLVLIGIAVTEVGLSSPALSVPLPICKPCQNPPGCALPPERAQLTVAPGVSLPGAPVLTATPLQPDCPLVPASSQSSTK